MKQKASECSKAPSSLRIPHPRGQTLCWEGSQQLRTLSQGCGGSHHCLNTGWCLKQNHPRHGWILQQLVGQHLPLPLQHCQATPVVQHDHEGMKQPTALCLPGVLGWGSSINNVAPSLSFPRCANSGSGRVQVRSGQCLSPLGSAGSDTSLLAPTSPDTAVTATELRGPWGGSVQN